MHKNLNTKLVVYSLKVVCLERLSKNMIASNLMEFSAGFLAASLECSLLACHLISTSLFWISVPWSVTYFMWLCHLKNCLL